MESTIQEQLPSPLVKEEAVPVKSGVLADIEIRRDGQLQLQGRESGQLRIIVPLSIQASAYHQLQVRNRRRSSEPRKASVEARLQLFIDLDFDISADWHLKTAANVHYRWLEAPRLQLGRLSIDITDKIDEKLQEKLPDISANVEQRLAERDRLPDKMASLWERLSAPIPLQDAEDAWLLIDPQTLSVSAPTVSGAAIRLHAGMTGTIQTILGEAPLSAPVPLPPRTAPPDSQPDGLRLGVNAVLTWDALSARASQAMQGTEWPLTVSGAEQGTLEVTELTMYPSGTELAVGVSYTATSPVWETDGVLWMTGTPTLDVDGQQLTIEQFSYTVETTDYAIAGFNNAVIRDRLKEQVQSQLAYPFAPIIEEQLAQANDRLTGVTLPRGGTLSASVQSAEVRGIYMTEEALSLHIELLGSAKFRLPPPKPPDEDRSPQP
jgi:hypothetical protein